MQASFATEIKSVARDQLHNRMSELLLNANKRITLPRFLSLPKRNIVCCFSCNASSGTARCVTGDWSKTGCR